MESSSDVLDLPVQIGYHNVLTTKESSSDVLDLPVQIGCHNKESWPPWSHPVQIIPNN